MPAKCFGDGSEIYHGWNDASRGVKFQVWASRPWRYGWALYHQRERCRRFYAAIEHTSMTVH